MPTITEEPNLSLQPLLRSGDATVIAHGSVIAFDVTTSVEIEFSVRDDFFTVILEQQLDAANPQPAERRAALSSLSSLSHLQKS